MFHVTKQLFCRCGFVKSCAKLGKTDEMTIWHTAPLKG